MILGLPHNGWQFSIYYNDLELWPFENQKFHKVAFFNSPNIENSGGPLVLFLMIAHFNLFNIKYDTWACPQRPGIYKILY